MWCIHNRKSCRKNSHKISVVIYLVAIISIVFVICNATPIIEKRKFSRINVTCLQDFDSDTIPDSEYLRMATNKIEAIQILLEQYKIMKTYMNASADPCDNFYEFACGNYASVQKVPEDFIYINPVKLAKTKTQKNVQALLDQLIRAEVANHNSSNGKVVSLLKSCLNTEKLSEKGAKPLIDLINSLGGWPVLHSQWNDSHFNWINVSAKMQLLKIPNMFSHTISLHPESTEDNVLTLSPGISYPLSEKHFLNPNSSELNEYQDKIIKNLLLFGANNHTAKVAAEKIVNFEKELAKLYTKYPDDHDNRQYKDTNVGNVSNMLHGIDFRKYFNLVYGYDKLDESIPVVVRQEQFFCDLDELISKTSTETVANTMFWKIANILKRYLHESFQISDSSLNREKQCFHHVWFVFSRALDAIYVRKYFEESRRNDVEHIVKLLQQSFKELIEKSNWIDDITKVFISEKIDSYLYQIGYTYDVSKNQCVDDEYENYQIDPEAFFENMIKASEQSTRAHAGILFFTHDRDMVPMDAITYNLRLYNPLNAVHIPASVMNTPLYHVEYPQFLKYGQLGASIGHEMTHGIDQIGQTYNKIGLKVNWWNNASIMEYEKRASCILQQYNNYKMGNQTIDGKVTLDENLSDMGGVQIAFNAYKKWLETNLNNTEALEKEILPDINLTSKQLFFLSYSQLYCISIKNEAEYNRMALSNLHSPNYYRVIGTLSNLDEFAEEFSCRKGSKMNPTNKCHLL